MQKDPAVSSSVQDKRLSLQDKAHALGSQLSALVAQAKDGGATNAAEGDNDSVLVNEIAALAAEAQSWRDRAETSEAQVNVLSQELMDSQKENETAQTLNQALEAKVSQLQAEVRHTESSLNKSYNDTLEGLTEHMKMLESHATDVANENDQLRLQLTEAQGQLANSSAAESEGEVSNDLREENEMLKEQLTGLKTALKNSSNEAATDSGLAKEHQDLKIKNDELMFASTEAHRVSKFLQTKCEQLAREQETQKQQADAVLADEKFQRTEAQRVSKFLQTKCEQLAREKEGAVQAHAAALAEVNFGKTEAERVASFLQQKCEQLVKQQEVTQQKHEAAIADLTFQKTEAQRVSKFLESKLEKVLSEQINQKSESNDEEVAALQSKNESLEKHVKKLYGQVDEMRELIVEMDQACEGWEIKCTKLELEVEKLQKKNDKVVSSQKKEVDKNERYVKFMDGKVAALEERNKFLLRELDEYRVEYYSDEEQEEQQEGPQEESDYSEDIEGPENEESVEVNRSLAVTGQEASAGAEESQRLARSREATGGAACQDLDDLSSDNQEDPVGSSEDLAVLFKRNQELEGIIAKIKSEAKNTESTLNKSYNDTLDGLTNHIESLDEHISELTAQNEELREMLSIAEQKGSSQDAPEDVAGLRVELEGKIEKLAEERKRAENMKDDISFQLTESKRVAKFLEGKIEKLAEEKKLAENMKDDISFQLTESKRVAKFLEGKLMSVLDEKRAMEATREDLNFQLTEARRVSKFLETKIEKVLQEKHQNQPQETLSHVTPATEDSKELQERVKALDIENNALRFAKTETERVCKYLQGKLEESDKSSKALIAELKFMATEAQRVSTFLASKISKMVDEKKVLEDRATKLDCENSELRFENTEAQRVCKYLQGKLTEWETRQGTVLDDSDFKLAEAQRVSTFLGKKLNKAMAEKQEAIDEVEALKDKVTTLEKNQGEVNGLKKQLAERIETFEQQALSVEIQSSGETEALRSRIKELESKIKQITEESRASEAALNKSYNETLDGLTAHIQELERRHEASMVSSMSRKINVDQDSESESESDSSDDSSSADMGLERDLFQKKAYELGIRVSEMKKELSKKDDEVATLKESYGELRKQFSDFKQDAKDTEDNLNKSYNVTLSGLTTHIQEAEGKIEELSIENEELRTHLLESQNECSSLKSKLTETSNVSSAPSDDAEFKLFEAQRVTKFLEQKLTKVVQEKGTADGRIADLQSKVEKLQVEVVTLDMIIAKQKDKLMQQKEEKESSSGQVDATPATTESILVDSPSATGSTELVESLAACLSMARASQKETDERLVSLTSQLADKENQVQEYKETLDTHVGQAEELASLASTLADKQNEVQEYMEKLDTQVAKTEELEEQVAKLQEKSSRMQAQGEENSEANKSSKSTHVKLVSGFVAVPVRRVEGRPGSGLYFL